jgi:hypothetical protein
MDILTNYQLSTFGKAPKTTHNESIIAGIMHCMHAKWSCVISVSDEIDDSGIIGRYRIISRRTRKINAKQILYTFLY